MPRPTHYDVLGVSRDATPADIRQAYRRLVRQCHPDVAPGVDPVRFRSLHDAYELLSDDTRRREYDRRLAEPARPWRVEHASFGDEIAIDFPSVSTLVARVREAFAGEADRPTPLSAEVELSLEEALQGVRLPLTVPLRTTCPHCAGRGETWLEVCRGCDGRGERTVRHQVTVMLPPGLSGGERVAFTLASAWVPPTPVELRIAVRALTPDP